MVVKTLSEQDLRTMNERELRKLVGDLENDAKVLRKKRQAPSQQETEICYIQRELEFRRRFGSSFSSDHSMDGRQPTLEFETSA